MTDYIKIFNVRKIYRIYCNKLKNVMNAVWMQARILKEYTFLAM